MTHQLHLYYPKSRLFLTSIPKNGGTSLKNYFFDIEAQSTNLGQAPREHEDHGMGIHKLNKLFLSASTAPKDDSISVLVLRNPFSRVASVWVNKFLYAQNDYLILDRHREAGFARLGNMSPAEIRLAFASFLTDLSSSRNFLESNSHWRPQRHFYGDSSSYSIVLETEDLGSLPKLLLEHGIDQKVLSRCNLMHFNRSNHLIYEFLWSPGTIKLVEDAYDIDFAALRNAGIKVAKPKEVPDEKVPPSLAQDELQAILRSRLEGAEQLVRIFRTSKTWRYTTPIRRVTSLLEKLLWVLKRKR